MGGQATVGCHRKLGETLKITKLSPAEWAEISEVTHRIVFGLGWPSCVDRIDYALIATDDQGEVVGYGTFRELSSVKVYWQFGGAFPTTQGSVKTLKYYQESIAWIGQHYKIMQTYIENDNFPMLKLAMKVGYKVVGIRTTQGKILLEHEMLLEDRK